MSKNVFLEILSPEKDKLFNLKKKLIGENYKKLIFIVRYDLTCEDMDKFIGFARCIALNDNK